MEEKERLVRKKDWRERMRFRLEESDSIPR